MDAPHYFWPKSSTSHACGNSFNIIRKAKENQKGKQRQACICKEKTMNPLEEVIIRNRKGKGMMPKYIDEFIERHMPQHWQSFTYFAIRKRSAVDMATQDQYDEDLQWTDYFCYERNINGILVTNNIKAVKDASVRKFDLGHTPCRFWKGDAAGYTERYHVDYLLCREHRLFKHLKVEESKIMKSETLKAAVMELILQDKDERRPFILHPCDLWSTHKIRHTFFAFLDKWEFLNILEVTQGAFGLPIRMSPKEVKLAMQDKHNQDLISKRMKAIQQIQREGGETTEEGTQTTRVQSHTPIKMMNNGEWINVETGQEVTKAPKRKVKNNDPQYRKKMRNVDFNKYYYATDTGRYLTCNRTQELAMFENYTIDGIQFGQLEEQTIFVNRWLSDQHQYYKILTMLQNKMWNHKNTTLKCMEVGLDDLETMGWALPNPPLKHPVKGGNGDLWFIIRVRHTLFGMLTMKDFLNVTAAGQRTFGIPRMYSLGHLELLHRIETGTLYHKVKHTIQHIQEDRWKKAEFTHKVFVGAALSINPEQYYHPMVESFRKEIAYRTNSFEFRNQMISEGTCTWKRLKELVDKRTEAKTAKEFHEQELREGREESRKHVEAMHKYINAVNTRLWNYAKREVDKRSGQNRKGTLWMHPDETRADRDIQVYLGDDEWQAAGSIERRLSNYTQLPWDRDDLERVWRQISKYDDYDRGHLYNRWNENGLRLGGGYEHTIRTIAPPMRSGRITTNRQEEMDQEMGYGPLDFTPHFGIWPSRKWNIRDPGAPPERDYTDPPSLYYNPLSQNAFQCREVMNNCTEAEQQRQETELWEARVRRHELLVRLYEAKRDYIMAIMPIRESEPIRKKRKLK